MKIKTTTVKQEYNITEELLGVTSLNQFSMYVSASRLAMYSGYLSQYACLINPEERQIINGLDLDLGSASMSIKAPCDLTIKAVVSRFPAKKSGPRVVLYQSLDGVVGHIELPGYHSAHDEHGFIYKDLISLYPGLNIRKGAVISASPSYCEGGGFRHGIHLRTMYVTDVDAAEDAFVFSDTALERLAYIEIRTASVYIKPGEMPLPIYPDSKTYPGIGQKVREDGILMVVRKDCGNPSMLSKRGLTIIDPWDDKIKYTEAAGGEIIDLSITKGLYRNICPDGLSDMLDEEDTLAYNFSKTIIDLHRSVESNTIGALPITHSFNSFLADLELVVARRSIDKKRPTPHVKKNPIKGYLITFKIAKKVVPIKGAKFSDPYGGKGVVGMSKPKRDMPRDANGNYIDVIVNASSTADRMNLGRLNEQEFWSVREGCQIQMLNILGIDLNSSLKEIKEAIDSSGSSVLDDAWGRLMRLYEIASSDSYDFFSDIEPSDKIDWLVECLHKGISIKYSISDAIKYASVSKELIKEFKPLREPLRDRHSVYPQTYSGKVYYIALEPTPNSWSGVASGPTQIHGVLHSPSKEVKASKPYPYNPGKHISETEAAIIVFSAGEEALSLIMDRNCSIDTHSMMYGKILSAGRPLSSNNLSPNKLGSSMSIAFLSSHMTSLGYTFKYKK